MTTQPAPNITPFTYEGCEVRTLDINGEPWFVTGDVCDYFGVTNRNRVMQHVDPEDKGGTQIDTPGGRQTVSIVNESGLYTLLFHLQPTKARGLTDSEVEAKTALVRSFRRWVTHEVLPAIRQRGGYLTPEAAEEALTDPDFIIRLATDLKRARAEREAMAAYARELEPKAANYDRFLSGDGTYSIGAVAKILGRSQNKLFDELRNAGILIAKGAMRNTPYQKYMHHFTVRAHDYTRSDGTVGTSYTTKVQPSGLAFIQAKLGIGQGALI
jgi:prophage antirepressor-like protein